MKDIDKVARHARVWNVLTIDHIRIYRSRIYCDEQQPLGVVDPIISKSLHHSQDTFWHQITQKVRTMLSPVQVHKNVKEGEAQRCEVP